MNINGLLPVGSVVKLKNSTHRAMVIGVCQIAKDDHQLYDYIGCVFPEGYLGAENNILFNGDQIETIYMIGLQDGQSLLFTEKANDALKNLREKEKAASESV